MSLKPFDFKKEYRDLYLPADRPSAIQVPSMNFIMTDGSGDPNGNPEFEQAVEMLYGISWTIKMSKMKGQQPEGYYDYVVPPLEGLWWVSGGGFSFEDRSNWLWTVMIRQPDFVTGDVFTDACMAFAKKKPGLPLDKVRLEAFEEGLCVQVLHTGPYSTEPESMKKIEAFLAAEGLRDRVGNDGRHHEIYLGDPRKVRPESMKTVLRHPVRRV